MKTAPIVLFVYNRPWHTRRTVEALQRNELAAESDLFVFSDAAKRPDAAAAVAEVRDYIATVGGFRSVHIQQRDVNAGLARSIIHGVTEICASRGRVIVLEDDLLTSEWFLTYMNRALDLYESDEQVASIHGYCYPTKQHLPKTFFLRGADCWGWATWQRAWQQFEPDGSKLLQALSEAKLTRAFDFDGAYPYTEMLRYQIAGRVDSWAVRWHAGCFLNNQLTLYPGRSLIQNIGNDATGTHCLATDDYATSLADEPIELERIELAVSEQARRAFAEFLRGTRPGVLRRVIGRVARVLRAAT